MTRLKKITQKTISLLVGLSILCMAKNVGAEDRILPIYSVFSTNKQVAITFDCAWGADDIPDILNTLEKHQVKAAFFMVGDWMRKYPEAVKAIGEAGHDLGNHSDVHPHVTKMDKESIKRDIRLAHNTIKDLTGVDAIYYRPPYGEYNNTVIQAATECGYQTIQWDVDSLDWKNYGREELIKKVLTHKNLGPGSIILLHNATKYTKDALDELLTGLKEKGYTIVPISEMVLREKYTLDHAGRQYPEK